MVHSKCTKLEWEWVKTLELMESEEQCQAVLSSGDPNSDAVTSGDHLVIVHCLSYKA